MEALAKAVKEHADTFGDKTMYNTPLGEAAEKWAVHCVRHYTGDRLRRGLEIARALADFDGHAADIPPERPYD